MCRTISPTSSVTCSMSLPAWSSRTSSHSKPSLKTTTRQRSITAAYIQTAIYSSIKGWLRRGSATAGRTPTCSHDGADANSNHPATGKTSIWTQWSQCRNTFFSLCCLVFDLFISEGELSTETILRPFDRTPFFHPRHDIIACKPQVCIGRFNDHYLSREVVNSERLT